MKRYAQNLEEKNKSAEINDKAEFEAGLVKGSLRFALAGKFMSLRSCGLNHYLDDERMIVWERQGDQIIRTENDTNWIDELLDQEGLKR